MDTDMNDMPTIGIMSQIMHMSMRKATALFEKFHLKVGQAGILFAMEYLGEMSQRELASRMNVTPPSITAAIQKMEKLEFIKRRPDKKDQRIIRLSLTDKGRSYLAHIKEAAKEMDQTLFKSMSQEEKLLFRRLLLQMRENLVDEKEIFGMKNTK